MFLLSSPAPPAAPVPVPFGTQLTEVAPGVYEFDFIHVDEQGYAVTLTNGSTILMLQNTCTYPEFIEINYPLDPLCITDDPVQLSALVDIPGTTVFLLNGQPVTEINPAALGAGVYNLTVQHTPFDPAECTITVYNLIIEITEDCLAELGDYVWEDQNGNGLQDLNEPPIPGVTVKLLDANGNLLNTDITDQNGIYGFSGLLPGNYIVMFVTPDGFNQTTPNAGDDNLDSDAGVNGMTPVITLMEGESNLSIDAGYQPACSIQATFFNITCNNQGTADTGDDTFTFEVIVSGENTGVGWTADDPNNTVGVYNANTLFGPYLISNGTLNITITDINDNNCTTTISVHPPPPCPPDECAISATVLGVSPCDDNGTADQSDDTYAITVLVTGDNTGSGWTANDPNGTNGFYNQVTTFGPYLIADGILNITITDNADPNCVTVISVIPPPPCSVPECAIQATFSNILCDDNGTASPNDDTYTFQVFVSGSNTSTGWTANDPNNTSGAYNTVVGFGPFLISDGPLVITFTDNDDENCTYTITVVPPPPCSVPDECSISATFFNVVCHDNGTTTPADDTYTFQLLVNGTNTGSGWTANDPNNTTGSYGTVTGFGPFLISSGVLQLTIVDNADPNCIATLSISPPPPCSITPECSINANVFDILCYDNGTPADPSDDTFTFNVIIFGTGNSSGWSANDPNNTTGAYDVPVVFGPYPVSGGDLVFTIIDDANQNCEVVLFVPRPFCDQPPCVIEAELIGNPQCQGNGTPFDPTDDTFTFQLIVTGLNASVGFLATDPNSTFGLYGIPITFGPYPISGGDLSFAIMDLADPNCTTVVTIPAPPTCSDDCDIVPNLVSVNCHDNGTGLDPSDDTYTFVMIITGQGTSGSWVATDPNGTTGAYNVPVTFGPYAISNGDLSFMITDIDQPDCTTSAFVAVPATCSDDCLLTTQVSDPICDDNGTADPSDDTFTFTVLVEAINANSVGWLATDPNTTLGFYGTAQTFGPYPVSLGSITFSIIDFANADCNTEVTVSVAPTVECPLDTDFILDEQGNAITLICTDIGQILDNPESLIYTGEPTVSGGCGGAADISFSDEVEGGGECQDAIITRTFTIIDLAGNEIRCTQIITIRTADIDAVIFPEDISFDCNEAPTELDANGNPAPSITGFPQIRSAFDLHDLDDNYCNLNAIYTDGPRIETCPGSYLIEREWRVMDYCDPDNVITMVQNIGIGDFTPPEVTCPLSNHYCPILESDIMLFELDAFACEATIEIPYPDVTDDCSTWEVLTEIWNEAGEVLYTIEESESRIITGIEPGDYTIRYTVADECGNIAIQDCLIRVADTTSPVAICAWGLQVSLNTQGLARTYISSIDAGSFDNCAIANMEVRRLYEQHPDDCGQTVPFYSDWGEYVEYNCCDINNMVTVELRVTDASGNENICWVDVLVEDKIAPLCTGLADAEVSCSELPANFDPYNTEDLQTAFGQAMALDNCEAVVEELEPEVVEDASGNCIVHRQFIATDLSGNVSDTLSQMVLILVDHPDCSICTPPFPEEGGEVPVEWEENLELTPSFGGAAKLYQNKPNPFKDQTIIGFELPEEQSIVLGISDATGRVIKVYKGTFPKGYNEIEIENNDLPQGVLYYTLDTDSFTDTRRMLKID